MGWRWIQRSGVAPMILKDFVKTVNDELKIKFENHKLVNFKLKDIMVSSCAGSLFNEMISYHEGRKNLIVIDANELVLRVRFKKIIQPHGVDRGMSAFYIEIETGFVSFANMELDDIYFYFKKKYAQKEVEKVHEHSRYVEDFEDMLKEKNLSHSEFKAMLEKYNLANKI